MPLVRDDDTVRFVPQSDPLEWFDLKRELSSGDDDAVWDAVVKMDLATMDQASLDALNLHVRATMMNRERVRRSIAAWSYAEDGVPVLVTDANMDRIDRRTYAELVEEVDRLNPLVPPKPSNGSSGSSSATSAATGRRRKA